MFPNDTKNVTIDDHSGTSGVLLPQTSYDRTALMGTIYCSGARDNHIILGSTLTQPNNNNFVDSESTPRTQTYIYRKIPANTDVYYSKGQASTNCFFTLLYTDYDLSTTTTATTTATINAIMTSGDIMIILLLIMIFTQLFFSSVKEWLFGVRVENPTKNKYNQHL